MATSVDLDKPTVANGHLLLSLLLADAFFTCHIISLCLLGPSDNSCMVLYAKNCQYPLHLMVITEGKNRIYNMISILLLISPIFRITMISHFFWVNSRGFPMVNPMMTSTWNCSFAGGPGSRCKRRLTLRNLTK